MCKNNNLFFKTWTLVFYVYYVTNNSMLQAMETESVTASSRSTGYPVNKALRLVRDLPTTPGWAAIQHDDKQLVNRTIKTESFAEYPRYVTWLEKTELTLVCDSANTSAWAAIQHEDRVLVNGSTLSSVVSYTLPSLSCKDMGHYMCETNTTRHLYVLVFGCPPKLCLPHDKVLEADLREDVMFDVCVLIPAPFSNMPITVNYKNTWLYKGQCVSRLCVTWTNVEFYRFNVKILISNVSKEDYGEIKLKFGTSHAYENYTFNYFPLLVPRSTNDSNEDTKYMLVFMALGVFCFIGCGFLIFKKGCLVRQSIQQFRQDFVSRCYCLRQN
ncbi:uncharacterized protein LOC131928447 [Physella acuta]|uniref:uncharacterized protein LOC131928447 n=1 Tax=Physella acuta TaxID=109671 RepID=UPI0027DE14DF|nr:uncharacterized protein LOC131928447 [Physella acuta]XP_059140588.1 uncharacterized protein LOC131928447 [Physella acuta]